MKKMEEKSMDSHLLRPYNFLPKKELRSFLGQNFIIDPMFLRSTVRLARLQSEDMVLEFGTGLGALTYYLAPVVRGVFTVEISARLLKFAQNFLKSYSNVYFCLADALRNKNSLNPAWIDAFGEVHSLSKPFVVVANLPYQIASSLIVLLLRRHFEEAPFALKRMLVLVQREVGERFLAKPNQKNYGRLSVMVQSMAVVRRVKLAPPNIFWPRPRVMSALMEVIPRKGVEGGGLSYLDKLVRLAFTHRRKKLGFNLAPLASSIRIQSLWEEVGIDPSQRPEEISVQKYLRLALLWKKLEDG
ncbi:MAG: ribosomal RNA small subunit methyltransferase A [Planctomycetota bacterium]|nr:MAG: ribosomal RNA small subunit methyltransferase A [Planctomycetota bacterium]